jgi:hypothetical protein
VVSSHAALVSRWCVDAVDEQREQTDIVNRGEGGGEANEQQSRAAGAMRALEAGGCGEQYFGLRGVRTLVFTANDNRVNPTAGEANESITGSAGADRPITVAYSPECEQTANANVSQPTVGSGLTLVRRREPTESIQRRGGDATRQGLRV